MKNMDQVSRCFSTIAFLARSSWESVKSNPSQANTDRHTFNIIIAEQLHLYPTNPQLEIWDQIGCPLMLVKWSLYSTSELKAYLALEDLNNRFLLSWEGSSVVPHKSVEIFNNCLKLGGHQCKTWIEMWTRYHWQSLQLRRRFPMSH